MKTKAIKLTILMLVLLITLLVSLAVTGLQITMNFKNSNGAWWDKYSLQLLGVLGHHSAPHILASLQVFQSDNEQERREGFSFLQSEAEQGSCYSIGKIGWAYQKGLGVDTDLKKAIVLYEEAATCGMTYWQILLAHAHQEGYLGLESNEDLAMHWRDMQSKTHTADYNCWVANYYQDGTFPKNDEKESYYQKACLEQ